MAPLGRIHRLLRISAAFATDRRIQRGAQLLLALGLLFVLLRLRTIWHDSSFDLGRVGWWWLGGGAVLVAASVAAAGAIWLVILSALGVPAQPHWLGIFLQAQLTKYIPGS